MWGHAGYYNYYYYYYYRTIATGGSSRPTLCLALFCPYYSHSHPYFSLLDVTCGFISTRYTPYTTQLARASAKCHTRSFNKQNKSIRGGGGGGGGGVWTWTQENTTKNHTNDPLPLFTPSVFRSIPWLTL